MTILIRWYLSAVFSPLSQEEEPNRNAPKIITSIKLKIVKVMISSRSVNPAVATNGLRLHRPAFSRVSRFRPILDLPRILTTGGD